MFTAYSITYIMFGIRCKRIIRVAANDNRSFATQDRRMVSHASEQQVALFLIKTRQTLSVQTSSAAVV